MHWKKGLFAFSERGLRATLTSTCPELRFAYKGLSTLYACRRISGSKACHPALVKSLSSRAWRGIPFEIILRGLRFKPAKTDISMRFLIPLRFIRNDGITLIITPVISTEGRDSKIVMGKGSSTRFGVVVWVWHTLLAPSCASLTRGYQRYTPIGVFSDQKHVIPRLTRDPLWNNCHGIAGQARNDRLLTQPKITIFNP